MSRPQELTIACARNITTIPERTRKTLMPTDYTEHVFQTSDGLRIHFRDYRPTETEAGPPVLCLHGLTRNARDFEELAPMIADLSRRVIAPSQRGRGLSDRDEKIERYQPGIYAADMLALLDHLDMSRAVFVGTSMGGLITMVVAAQAPQRLCGAVLNDIGPEIDPVGLDRIRNTVGAPARAASWEEAAALCRGTNGAAFPAEVDRAFWIAFAKRVFCEDGAGGFVLDYDPQIATSIAGAPGGPAPDLWPLFATLLAIPTLVIRGELSDILMTSTVREMQRRKADLVVATVRDVGHAPFMTEADAWPALRAFLSGTR
jgi:pimeloyl-ACP methyl ester carboxylesterase